MPFGMKVLILVRDGKAIQFHPQLNLPFSANIVSPFSGSVYHSLDYISHGSYGMVYKAKASDSSLVAIKFLVGHRVEEEDLLKEEAILNKLHDSPKKDFFIHLRESFKIEGGTYIQIYEYMETDLRAYMDRYSVIPMKDARNLLHQLLQALSQLKILQIIHADLKPANIMVNSHMALKVIDFGLSHTVAEVHNHTDICSLHYRAPEVILGAGYNESIDMWAFGCIAAEMLTEQKQYPGTSEFEMIQLFLKTHGKFPHNLVHSSKFWSNYFEKKDGEYIPRNPEKYGYSIRDVGSTFDRMHLRSGVNFTQNGLVRHSQLANIVQGCLSLDPAFRMEPEEVLEEYYFSRKVWDDEDSLSTASGETQTRARGSRTPSIPTQKRPSSPSHSFRSRSPVIVSL